MSSWRNHHVAGSAFAFFVGSMLTGCGQDSPSSDAAPSKEAGAAETSPYEELHDTLRDVTDEELRARTAQEANQKLGLDDSGIRYLTFSNEDWCVTDGKSVLSFSYYGDGAALLFSNASSPPSAEDCATVDYDTEIPADVEVAFRTDPETHQYRLEKGGDLVSQEYVNRVEENL